MPSLARSVPKPLKVPSLARSVQKPLKVPSLARSVSKPLKVPSLARSVPKPRVGQAGGLQTCHLPSLSTPYHLVVSDDDSVAIMVMMVKAVSHPFCDHFIPPQ